MASSNADEWYLKIAEQVYGPVRTIRFTKRRDGSMICQCNRPSLGASSLESLEVRTMFVFSVCRLVSWRCHNISAMLD